MAVFSVVLIAAAADQTSYFDSILHVTERRAVVVAVVMLSREDEDEEDDDDWRIGVGESEADDDDEHDDEHDVDEATEDEDSDILKIFTNIIFHFLKIQHTISITNTLEPVCKCLESGLVTWWWVAWSLILGPPK